MSGNDHSKSNVGVFFASPSGPETRTFVVLGAPRSGTTIVTRLLDAAGIYMGCRREMNWEDPEFASLLSKPAPSIMKFEALVESRNSEFGKWGFKAPFRHHWPLLRSLDRTAFVSIYRDPAAVALRNVKSAGADFYSSFESSHEVQRQIIRFVRSSDAPSVSISYEKLLISPHQVLTQLSAFLGLKQQEDFVRIGKEIIMP